MTEFFDKQRFRKYVATSGILEHSFFKKINDDNVILTRLLLIEFLKSDYMVAKEFGQYLAYLISKIDDTKIRMLLIENLWDEHGNGTYSDIHFEQYRSLLRSINIDESQLVQTKSEFIDLHYQITNKNILDGIAMFTYADEFLSMYEFAKIKKACKSVFDSLDERYFRSNQEADINHTRKLEEALDILITSSEKEESAFNAVQMAIRSRIAFYDKIVLNFN